MIMVKRSASRIRLVKNMLSRTGYFDVTKVASQCFMYKRLLFRQRRKRNGIWLGQSSDLDAVSRDLHAIFAVW